MKNNHFEEILTQVLSMPNINIDSNKMYSERYLKFGSLFLLVLEHFRLCAIWAKRLNYPYERDPRMNLLQLINKEWEVQVTDDYILEVTDKFPQSRMDIRLYISWHFYREQIDTMGYSDLPYDPYEPLWKFILRKGGGIRYDAGGVISILHSEFGTPEIDKMLMRQTPFIDIHSEEDLNNADKEFLVNKDVFIEKYMSPYVTITRLIDY
jgi:hypothetical protein